MSLYHLHAEPVSRSQGRAATAAAAYRAGARITDQRTGEVFDYTRKKGVLYTQMILPGGGTADRAEFWNKIEAHHKRNDAVVAREVEISLPRELSPERRQEMAVRYAAELAERYGVAADIGMHEPDKVTDRDLERDPEKYWEIDPLTGRRHNANWHAHILMSACSVSAGGTLGKKVEVMDPIHCQRKKIPNMVEFERERWATIGADALEHAGFAVESARFRVGHLTLPEQVEAARQRGDLEFVQKNENRVAQKHLGPAAVQYERRTHQPSRKRLDWERDPADGLAEPQEVREAELTEQERIASQGLLQDGGKQATRRYRYKSVQSADRLPVPNEVRQKGIRWLWQVCQRSIQTLVKRMVVVVREAGEAKRNRSTTKGNEDENRRKPDPLWTFGRYDDSFGVYELNAFQNQSVSQAESFNDLRDLSSIDVVPGRLRGEVLLSSDAVNQLANGEPDGLEALRRNTAGKRSVMQLGRNLQRIKRQIGASSIVQSAGEDKPHLDGLSKEKLGQLLVEQLMNTELEVRKSHEHERDKPSPS
jgi:hypothetical protein